MHGFKSQECTASMTDPESLIHGTEPLKYIASCGIAAIDQDVEFCFWGKGEHAQKHISRYDCKATARQRRQQLFKCTSRSILHGHSIVDCKGHDMTHPQELAQVQDDHFTRFFTLHQSPHDLPNIFSSKNQTQVF